MPMAITRVRSLPSHYIIAAGSVLCVAAMVAWMTAAASGQGASVKPPVATTQILVSVGTLDMSRLLPSQFGDWDAVDHPTK